MLGQKIMSGIRIVLLLGVEVLDGHGEQCAFRPRYYLNNGSSLTFPIQEHSSSHNRASVPTHLPSVCREDVLVPFVPVSFHHLARMRVRLLLGRVVDQTDVLGHPKVKQRTGLPASLCLDELVEGVVLGEYDVLLLHTHTREKSWTYACMLSFDRQAA